MTMLDDDRLASLFAGAAAAFEVPARVPTTYWDWRPHAWPRPPGMATSTIPTSSTATTVGRRRWVAHRGRARAPPGAGSPAGTAFSSVAACIVVLLVLAGAVGTFVRSPARPTVAAAPLHRPVKVPATAPSTTTTTPGPPSRQGRPTPRARPPRRAISASRPVRRAPTAPHNGRRACPTERSASPPRSSRPAH